jgi:hypothetical protein
MIVGNDTPWYDRNWVLWVGGTVVVIALSLMQPFITPNWPETVNSWFGRPVVRLGLAVAAAVAVFSLGVTLGSRLGRRATINTTTAGTHAVPPELLAEPQLSPDDEKWRSVRPIDMRWNDLQPEDRALLWALWHSPAAFMLQNELHNFHVSRGHVTAQINAIDHTLRERLGLIQHVQRPLPGQPLTFSPGLALSLEGKRMMAWAWAQETTKIERQRAENRPKEGKTQSE